MRYSKAFIAASSLLAASTAQAAHLPQQLTFLGEQAKAGAFDLDAAGKEAISYLQGSRELVEEMASSFAGNNVVKKGEKWVKEHINDPRFKHIYHAEFPEYRLRINTKSPSLCDPDVKQISGYLDVAGDKHLFFWFFESRRNPKKDPLTMWLNGGPGCSSSTGLLFELGPCLIAANGTKTVYNPYSWNEVSNMIFLDQPVAVGYSYTEGQQVVTTADAAKDVYAFLQLFMKSFPQYSALDFNIAGESYGGTYIPQFAGYIHDKAQRVRDGDVALTSAATEAHAEINLKSIMIGNGLTDPYIQFASVPEYACAPSEHAFVDESQCTTMRNKVSTCQRLQTYCYNSPSRFTCTPAALYCWGLYGPMQSTDRNLYDIRRKCDRNGEDGPLCYKEMGWIEAYLNQPDVKEQLGVAENFQFTSCNMDVNRAFLMTGDSQHNSAAFLPPLIADGIRVLIYAGNQDAMCNAIGNKEWFVALDNVFAKDIKKAKDQDFVVKHKTAGQFLSAGPGAGNYTYLEVFDAGHMVPTDQPEAALQMFSKWLANKPF